MHHRHRICAIANAAIPSAADLTTVYRLAAAGPYRAERLNINVVQASGAALSKIVSCAEVQKA